MTKRSALVLALAGLAGALHVQPGLIVADLLCGVGLALGLELLHRSSLPRTAVALTDRLVVAGLLALALGEVVTQAWH